MTVHFEWDDNKAAINLRKQGVTFELASTVFRDPELLTKADSVHSETEDRWFSGGWAANGAIVAVVYLWSELDEETILIRLISVRQATRSEIRSYSDGRE